METHIELKKPKICWKKMDNFLSKSGSLFNYNMVQFSLDKYIICFYSKNDPYVKYEAEKEFADTVATKQIVIDDGGHLNSESGYTEFKELLEYL